MKRPRKGDWVVAADNGAKCLRCGESLRMSMPVLVSVYLAACKAFVKQHKGCKERTPHE